jgi:hypothetical protein
MRMNRRDTWHETDDKRGTHHNRADNCQWAELRGQIVARRNVVYAAYSGFAGYTVDSAHTASIAYAVNEVSATPATPALNATYAAPRYAVAYVRR